MSAVFTIMFPMRTALRSPWLTRFVIVGLGATALIALVAGERENIEAVTLAFAAVSGLAALAAVEQAAKAGREARQAPRLERLERVGELVGELGERVSAARNLPGAHPWNIATLTQLRLHAAFTAVEEEFELPSCALAVDIEPQAGSVPQLLQATTDCLAEVNKAMRERERS